MCGTDKTAQVSKNSPSSIDVSESENNGSPAIKLPMDAVLNLNQGDPTMFEAYWRKSGDKCTVTIAGDHLLSYFSDPGNMCWFLEPKLGEAIKKLHRTVGNAVTEDRHIIVGTGSTQLYQAVLYALCSGPDQPNKPVSVVSALPYYSAYPHATDYLRSSLYKWVGDANTFDPKDGPYIELVTTPNNPDGAIRKPVVVNRGGQGKLIYDFAYYWPQFTPITATADYDIMLFTASKCTGHAGSRIGWAIVKDKDVAKKMIHFLEISSIGVSRESQLRTARILETISTVELENFFEYGQRQMAKRWKKLRDILKRNAAFKVLEYPKQYCLFSGEVRESYPAFAWFEACNEDIEDGESFFKGHKIMARGGRTFGADPKCVRVSMVSREEEFNLFLERLERLSAMKGVVLSNGNGNHVSNGGGNHVGYGNGNHVGNGNGNHVGNGIGNMISNMKGVVLSNGNGNHVSNGGGNHVGYGNGNHVGNGNGNHVGNGNGNHVSNGIGNHVSNGNGNHVSKGNGNHVSNGNGNGIADGEN